MGITLPIRLLCGEDSRWWTFLTQQLANSCLLIITITIILKSNKKVPWILGQSTSPNKCKMKIPTPSIHYQGLTSGSWIFTLGKWNQNHSLNSLNIWYRTMKNTQERTIVYWGKNWSNDLIYHFIISRECVGLIHKILHCFYAGMLLDENCIRINKIGLKK